MANELLNCNTDTSVTGQSNDCQIIFAAIQKKFLTTYEFQFDTVADLLDESKWATGITGLQVFPIIDIEETDDTSTEAGIYESAISGNKKYVSEGKTSKLDRLTYDTCMHKRLRTFNNKRVRIIEIDKNGIIKTTSPDGIIQKGFECSDFYVGKYIDAPDKDSIAFTPMYTDYRLVKEREDQAVASSVTWSILSLNGVQPATLTVVGTPTATEIIVDVATACGAIPIGGITETTDFKVLKADLVTAEAVTLVAESGTVPGRYTLTGVAFESLGTVNTGGNTNNVITLVGSYYKGTAVTITFP